MGNLARSLDIINREKIVATGSILYKCPEIGDKVKHNCDPGTFRVITVDYETGIAQVEEAVDLLALDGPLFYYPTELRNYYIGELRPAI